MACHKPPLHLAPASQKMLVRPVYAHESKFLGNEQMRLPKICNAEPLSYTTPGTTEMDNASTFGVIVTNVAGSTASNPAVLIVNSSPSYAVRPGYIVTDLNNDTGGAWANGQTYVTVIGIDPGTGRFAWLKSDGTIVDFTLNDSSAPGHLTQNGQNFGNFSFTLEQSAVLMIPAFVSARAYISLGASLYVQVNGDGNGSVTGYAGPNPLNPADPNINTHFDWYEFNNQNGVFINTTQVDAFGLPLLLDVWGSGETYHQQVGIAESIAQIDSEFATQVPAQFQPPSISSLRIFSPATLSMAAGAASGNHFDSFVAGAWATYTTTPLSIALNGRQFSGTVSGSALTFHEVNPAAVNVWESFVLQRPST
jgi:beta-galactosidase